MVTGIAEGSLYIDIDNDSHSVLSLDEGSDAAREYFLSTGMISSLYESTVWEEITGEESVSTISILAKASEENIDILLLSKANLSTEIEKMNTDSTTKQSIINAVNSGMIVTVPAEEVTMGDWSGTGYIVTNPETGVGEYMISSGLNGGVLEVIAGIPVMLASFLLVVGAVCGITMAISGILVLLAAFTPVMSGIALAAIILGIVSVISSMAGLCSIWSDYSNYILTGDVQYAESSFDKSKWVGIWTIVFTLISIVIGKLFFKWCEYYVKETGGSGETGGNGSGTGDGQETSGEIGNVVEEGETGSLEIDELVVRDTKFLNAEGDVDWETWAPNGGRVPGTIKKGQILKIGTIIDRYGNQFGNYTSPEGVPYEQRSLPYIENPKAYHKYEVLKPIDNVTISEIAPAFEQEGGGIQYELPSSIMDLIEKGYLKEIK